MAPENSLPAHVDRVCPPVLTAEAMQAADAHTIESFGLPGFTLMESAGRAAADIIAHHYGRMPDASVAVLCGKGNNGGDGLVIARELAARGAAVTVVLMASPAALRTDPARNLKLLQRLMDRSPAGDRITLHVFDTLAAFEEQMAATRPTLLIDALLGTGLTSDVRSPIREAVQWANQQAAPTVAIDVPTGLNSDTGAVLGNAITADRTITMAAYKAGLLVGKGATRAGAVEVVDIGIPTYALDDAAQAPGCARRTTDAAISALLPDRAPDAHKYSAGMALVVGGSGSYPGAPALSARAAGRIGAGYVMAATAAPARDQLAGTLPEIPTRPLPTNADGLQSDASFDALREPLDKARALCIGPGLGRAPGTERFVRDLLRRTDQPAVIDADGLNALSGHIDQWSEFSDGRWILTPHAGEFRRLAGSDVSLDNRIQTAATYAERWNSVLILKGMPSIVGCPDGSTYINGTGNPALATAGTGDVLAGFCAGLLAQGAPPAQAALAALHIGGAVADAYAAQRAARTMQALDLVHHLPSVLTERYPL